jgi:hypothetical protein
MRKKLRVLVIAVLVFPFVAWPLEQTGLPEQEHWITLPAGGFLTVTGVSGRRIRRDREIENAREDAALKVLWYHGLKGSARTLEFKAPGPGRAFSAETSLEPLSPGLFPAIKEALRFDPKTDVVRTPQGVFVRFTCPAPGAEALDYRPAAVRGVPGWTRRPPKIAGYVTAAGFAGKRRSIRETVLKSYENAAAALIAGRSIHMETLDGDYPGRASFITGTSEGELTGFMVLERWIDPETRGVWTLAAVPQTSGGEAGKAVKEE